MTGVENWRSLGEMWWRFWIGNVDCGGRARRRFGGRDRKVFAEERWEV